MTGIDSRAACRLIVALLVFQVVALFVRAWLQRAMEQRGLSALTAADVSYLAVPPLLAVLCWPLARRHRELLAHGRLEHLPGPGQVLAAIGIGALLRIAWWAQFIATGSTGGESLDAASTVDATLLSISCPPAGKLLLHLAIMALVVPVVEEIINRGWLLRALIRFGAPLAVLGSSLLFAVFHPPSSILFASFCGSVLGLLALRSGSLWPPIMAHATYNGLMALDWLCLRTPWRPGTTPDSRLLVWSVALTAAALSLLLAASPGSSPLRHPRTRRQQPDDDATKRSRRAR